MFCTLSGITSFRTPINCVIIPPDAVCPCRCDGDDDDDDADGGIVSICDDGGGSFPQMFKAPIKHV
jgi:hypothetical protein